MQKICEVLGANVATVVAKWEEFVREQPWYLLPSQHRIDNLPDLILGLNEAALCNPHRVAAHRHKIEAAVEHGMHRRSQGIPESLIFTEYHLLRQAIWYVLIEKLGPTVEVVAAIIRIDTAITVATNASMWGYHREEIEALGKWEQGIERIVNSSPFLI